jgi:hypothetical protein
VRSVEGDGRGSVLFDDDHQRLAEDVILNRGIRCHLVSGVLIHNHHDIAVKSFGNRLPGIRIQGRHQREVQLGVDRSSHSNDERGEGL